MTPDAFPPPWAARWGDDEYGLWADLEVKGVAQRMRWLAPGEFQMGAPDDEIDAQPDEKPQHRVRVSQGFWIADTPCTQLMWQVVIGQSPGFFKGNSLPVETVSWESVEEFRLALDSGLDGSVRASLPSEAEWEFACRAGSTTSFNFGSRIDAKLCNVDSESFRTVPVKTFHPNAWGLFDCHGQVSELCSDGPREYHRTAPIAKVLVDPTGPRVSSWSNDRCAIRGGSWTHDAKTSRSATRENVRRTDRRLNLGFRFTLKSTAVAVATSTIVSRGQQEPGPAILETPSWPPNFFGWSDR
jgi:formylglycine-generating enzyme